MTSPLHLSLAAVLPRRSGLALALVSTLALAASIPATVTPAAAQAQDLSRMPQHSVLDGPAPRSRTPVPGVAPAPGAPVAPMVSNPVVQPVPVVSRPVVQPVPAGAASTNASQALNAALSRLAREPGSVEALLEAGQAAMTLGDMDAALGFLRRAEQIAPGNGAVKAQIAKAMLRANDPLSAIRAFDEAERAGADLSALVADRGLAHDLVGDNAMAQRYYRQALLRGADPETSRRLALSLAIAGDRAGAEAVLAPLLAGSDRASWRARTFILAIAGNAEEAVGIANTSMPPQLAGAIAPYLRYMTRLTPAQQAAAANFGRFPRAADIGRDEPGIVQYALAHPRQAAPVQIAAATPVATPTPLSRRARAAQERAARARGGRPAATPLPATGSSTTTALAAATPGPAVASPAAVPPGPVTPSITTTTGTTTTGTVTLAAAAPVATAPAGPSFVSSPVVQAVPQPQPAPQPQVAAATPVVLPPVPAAATPAAPVQVASAAPQPAVGQPPAGQPAATQPAPSPADFAALFAGFSAPAEEQERPVVAVDLAAIQAANERAAAEKAAVEARKAAEAKRLAEAKKAIADKKALAEKKLADAKKAEEARKAKEEAKRLAANPARTWVQVLTGGNRAKMGVEWARLQAGSPELRGRKAYVTSWNRVYRLVTGPFPSDSAAQEFVAKLKKAGVGAFQFDSPAGQAMDGVSAK